MTNEKRSCEVKLRINCLIIFIIHLSPVFIINKVASTVESRKHIEQSENQIVFLNSSYI